MNWRSNLQSWVVSAVFLLSIVSAAAGEVIYVDVDANGLNDGSSWADAYICLQDALADANSAAKPVEILVAQGIYTPDSNSAEPNGSGDRTSTFHLINGVSLKGGYAGFDETEPNDRDIELYETILSGDLNDDDLPHSPYNTGENSFHVVTGSGTDVNAVLDGFTIRGGKGLEGGGMYNNFGSPTISNCAFIGNSGIYGAGMWNDGGSPIVSDCLFTGNIVSRYGGAILNEGSLRISNCAFIGNSADLGGGILNRSSLRISNCTFVGNRGAGICNQGFTQTSNCIFWGNTPYQLIPNIPELLYATYSNVQDGWPGEGNMDIDPCFVELGYWDDPCNTPYEDWDDIWIDGDYHLKSQAGRWEPNNQSWVQDDVTSPCIDAGDPMSPIGLEPFPNGGWINMGAFGGTVEASKAYFGEPVCEIIVAGDINGDCKVNFLDFRIMSLHWLEDNNPLSPPFPPPPPPGG